MRYFLFFLLLSFAPASLASASIVQGQSGSVPLAFSSSSAGGANWSISGPVSASSSSAAGFAVSLFAGTSQAPGAVTVGVPLSAPVGSYTLTVQSESTQSFGTYQGSFTVSSVAPPPPASAPCAVGSFTPGSYGLGVDGAPVPCSYWSGSKQFQQNIAPLLTKLLLLLFGSILVLWLGIKIGKSLIHKTGLGYGKH